MSVVNVLALTYFIRFEKQGFFLCSDPCSTMNLIPTGRSSRMNTKFHHFTEQKGFLSCDVGMNLYCAASLQDAHRKKKGFSVTATLINLKN